MSRLDDGIRSCKFCLWDIKIIDGRWRLAWPHVDYLDDGDCNHEPMENVNAQ